MATDYYALLGVPRDAGEDDIKKAYRRLARELHPDTRPDDAAAEERFKEVTLAYETLRDPERRRRYDMFGPEGARAGAGAGTGGDPFAGFGTGGLGDIFDAFFGSGFGFGTRTSQGGPRRGADVEAVLDLGFDEAVFGARREVRVRGVPVACAACGGSGARPGTYPSRCGECRGAGEVRRVRQSMLGQMVTSTPCPRCGGTGDEIASPCDDCAGQGRRLEEQVYQVEVPAGVDDGQQLRLSGQGAAGPRGGPRGDVYVHLRVAPHPHFERRGYDVVRVLHVPMTQAALGARIPLETLDGDEELAVPPGTQTGKVFTLRGRGVPHVDGRGRGDLLVHVVVDTPTRLSKTQEELLRRLAEEREETVEPADSGLLSRIRSAFS